MKQRKEFVIVHGVLEEYNGPGGDVVVPQGVTAIGSGAFSYSKSLTGITLPEGVKTIRSGAFRLCYSLNSITLSKGLKTIEDHAFEMCSGLERIVFPNGLRTIGSGAFDGTKLISVSLPRSLVTIAGASVFASVSELTVKEWTPVITKAFKGSTLVRLVTEDIYKVPPAYRGVSILTFISDAPSDLSSERAKSHMEYMEQNSGKLALLAAENPELLYFMLEHKMIKAKDIDAFIEASDKKSGEETAALLAYQNELGPEKVRRSREKKEETQEKRIEHAVEKINRRAQRTAEDGIADLTFVVRGTTQKWETRKEVGEYLSANGAKLGSDLNRQTDYLVTGDVRGNTTYAEKAGELGPDVISEDEFNIMVCKRFRDAEHITVPSWVRTIAAGAFSECKSMTGVTLPENLTTIGNGAFRGCENLKSITIPAGVTRIRSEAFSLCTNLESIVLSENNTIIEPWAFIGCGNLTIHAPAGSTAERYAKKFGFPFVAE